AFGMVLQRLAQKHSARGILVAMVDQRLLDNDQLGVELNEQLQHLRLVGGELFVGDGRLGEHGVEQLVAAQDPETALGVVPANVIDEAAVEKAVEETDRRRVVVGDDILRRLLVAANVVAAFPPRLYGHPAEDKS